MSYDLTIYSRIGIDETALRDLVEVAGLRVEGPTKGGIFQIVRGRTRRFCCTMSGPDSLEPEDVPHEIVGSVLNPGWTYGVTVEGSSPSDIPHAMKLARRIAVASDGAVFDQQTDEIWTRGKLRMAPKVEHGVIELAELHWYTWPHDDVDVAGVWLDCAERFLPEAKPRRFGLYEPLQGKFDQVGREGFIAAVRDAAGTIYLSPKRPCMNASLHSRPDGFRGHWLDVLGPALDDPDWRGSLHRFFLGFAESSGSIYAEARIRGGWEWDGRSLGATAAVGQGYYSAPRGEWIGLPPKPWWAWFGDPYAELVRDLLPDSAIQDTPSGFFCGTNDAPNGPLPTDAGPWLPDELLMHADTSSGHYTSAPLLPAAVIPEILRHSP